MAPIVAAWVQFELYVDQVWMFPWLTVLGGIAVGLVLGYRASWARAKLVGLALGLPLGVAGVWLPAHHFHAHMTSVRVLHLYSYDSYDDLALPWDDQPTFRVFRYELPPMPEPASSFEAASFPRVSVQTVAVGDRLASGEWVLRDGELYVRRWSGELVPLEMASADDLLTDMGRARKREQQRQRDARREALRHYHDRIRELRNSGRIFSRGA